MKRISEGATSGRSLDAKGNPWHETDAIIRRNASYGTGSHDNDKERKQVEKHGSRKMHAGVPLAEASMTAGIHIWPCLARWCSKCCQISPTSLAPLLPSLPPHTHTTPSPLHPRPRPRPGTRTRTRTLLHASTHTRTHASRHTRTYARTHATTRLFFPQVFPSLPSLPPHTHTTPLLPPHHPRPRPRPAGCVRAVGGLL